MLKKPKLIIQKWVKEQLTQAILVLLCMMKYKIDYYKFDLNFIFHVKLVNK